MATVWTIVTISLLGSIALGNPMDDCPTLLQKAGASDSFDAMVAHGIHSMNVDDLKLFDPSATEDNYVPTINLDLRSEQPILPYAPLYRTNDTSKFVTDGMKALDLVLSHMEDKHWELAAFTPLERVVHIFHMREIWARAKMEYDKIGKTEPIPDPKACDCAMDVEKNGIIRVMRVVAMAIREPSLVHGDPSFAHRDIKPGQYKYGYQYHYGFFNHLAAKNTANIPVKSMLAMTPDDAMPPLKDAKAWQYWKGESHPPVGYHKDLALFLYCAVQKAHK